MRIGKRLKIWRITHDMKAKDLAALLGCSSAFVSAVECGHKAMPAAWLRKLPTEFQAWYVEDAARRAREEAERALEGLEA